MGIVEKLKIKTAVQHLSDVSGMSLHDVIDNLSGSILSEEEAGITKQDFDENPW